MSEQRQSERKQGGKTRPRKRTQVREFDPRRVRPLPGQPRKRFGGIAELAASIGEVGQSTPGSVVLLRGDRQFDAQLIDGERRLRACTVAGVDFRAEVHEAGSIEDLFVASFAANFGKQDHDCLEVAEGLGRMKAAGKSIEQMRRIAGKSDCWVYQHLNLLKLCPEVRPFLLPPDDETETPRLSFQNAQLLVDLPAKEQLRLAKKISKSGLSRHAVRRLVLRERSAAGDADAYGGAGRRQRASMEGLESLLRDFGDRLGIYLDMPGAELRAVIDAANPRDRRLMAEQLDEAADNLKALAQTVLSRVPELPARVSA